MDRKAKGCPAITALLLKQGPSLPRRKCFKHAKQNLFWEGKDNWRAGMTDTAVKAGALTPGAEGGRDGEKRPCQGRF